jgi:hypothetical protein
MKKIAIHQPQVFPWLGYFEKIRAVDEFIFLDDVQYKKNEWQNRNKVRQGASTTWLTTPVKYRFGMHINEVPIYNTKNWKHKQLQALKSNYGKSPNFNSIFRELEQLYEPNYTNLIDFAMATIRMGLKHLNIVTPYKLSSPLQLKSTSTQRLIDICKTHNATTYLSGQGGKDYLDSTLFEKHNIQLEFQDYPHPIYDQGRTPFISHLCFLDYLFNQDR